jgi:hypothetical protein
MTERKTPVETALDLFVYAPIGLALTAVEELPKFVEKGREQVTTRTAMYRMIGKFAVQQGQQTAGRFFGGRPEPAPPPSPPAWAPPPEPAPAPSPAAPRPARTAPASGDADTVATDLLGGNGQRPGTAASDDLAIPGYDALSASQVVQRLAGLSADELESVRAYESATRGRKTILSRVAQLQSGA